MDGVKVLLIDHFPSSYSGHGPKFVRLWYLKSSGHGACNFKDIILSQRGTGIDGRQIGTNI